MAKGRSPRVPGGAAAPPASERDRLIDAALRLIARDGWRRLAMAAIAAEAELPILTLYRTFRSKPAILCAFFRRIDEAVVGGPPPKPRVGGGPAPKSERTRHASR